MRFAIASGKGGTGKTTLATHLAVAAARLGHRVRLVDCDVEAPNCHLFLEATWTRRSDALTYVPRIDPAGCTLCGTCAELCQFNALACLPHEVMIFPELCHGCGGCQLLCPEQCISESERVIGEIAWGQTPDLGITRGTLRIGEAMAPPLIRQVIDAVSDEDLVLLDAPPGTSCPVVTTVQQSDYVLLVTEPTPFGLHDLELALRMVRHLGLPHGVIINRALAGNGIGVAKHLGNGESKAAAFCREVGAHLLAELPDDRRVAVAYASGLLALDVVPGFAEQIATVLQKVLAAVEVPS